MFDSKIMLITGGTCTFGNAVLRRFLDTGIREQYRENAQIARQIYFDRNGFIQQYGQLIHS